MSKQAYQTFSVPSSGRLGVVHTVTVFTDTGDTRCTCEDATYRHRQCKHQRYVLATSTAAGRSGALVEAAQTAASVQAERDLQLAEARRASLGALLQQRHGWATAVECTCGYRCTRAESLEHHIVTRNQAIGVRS